MNQTHALFKLFTLAGVLLISGNAACQSMSTAKKPLDIEACEAWNRIDNPQISPTGRYVTYKVSPIKDGYSLQDKKPTMLYDSKTGKRREIWHAENITFYDHDKSLYYTTTDTAGNHQTYLMTLPAGEPAAWKGKEPFTPKEDRKARVEKKAKRQSIDRSEIPLPEGKCIADVSPTTSQNLLLVELRDSVAGKGETRKETKEERRRDDSFELELWTWNELEVPTLQTAHPYHRPSYDKYIYNRATKKLTKVAPAEADLLLSSQEKGDFNYVVYTDDTPYLNQKEWLDRVPFDVYAVNIHTGQTTLIGKQHRDAPKWAAKGRWIVMYDPIGRCWNKFDNQTGQLSCISSAIPYAVHDEEYDKPAPPPSYGLAGWTADGRYVFIMDAYDWWKIDLTGKEAPRNFTRGLGRKHKTAYRKLYCNIDKDVFSPKDEIYVTATRWEDMSHNICQIDMRGNIKTLTRGDYNYSVTAFSDNRQYCLWTRQNTETYPDLWVSKADFTEPRRVTDVNPRQHDYIWPKVKMVEWKTLDGKDNRGLLYLPEDYTEEKEYPVLVQFYETHTEEKNNYSLPMLSNAMANVAYMVSNGYVVFMPDVHFQVGQPGVSTYNTVVSGTNWLIDQGIAHRGRIALQGHSWSGYQATYLVTKTDLFCCAQIGAPITDMVTGYLGIRNGSGLPRYFMYEETQSRMGSTLWQAKEAYKAMSPLINADSIHTPLLIFHNDNDEAVAYEQGRALYLAMRRLQRPAWMVNYKGEGHFVLKPAAQRDWTIRMRQFFDYYLKQTKMPRWMAEGIQLKDRGYDQKYDLLK